MSKDYCNKCFTVHQRGTVCPEKIDCINCGRECNPTKSGRCMPCIMYELTRNSQHGVQAAHMARMLEDEALAQEAAEMVNDAEIETCLACGEHHSNPQCDTLKLCECGKQFRSRLWTRCISCVLRDLPARKTNIHPSFGTTFAKPQVAPPKRQTVPDAFYKVFE